MSNSFLAHLFIYDETFEFYVKHSIAKERKCEIPVELEM